MDQPPTASRRYQPPLPANSIRLLSLLPSRDPTAPISCSLSPSPLTERLSSNDIQTGPKTHRDTPEHEWYEALSYVWGTDPPSHSILINNQPVSVRTNLHDALRHLRLADTPRTLWVDAICINQADVAERNAQVGMMRQIYASAGQVVVWLGPGDDDADTDTAMEWIGGMGRVDAAIAARLVRHSSGTNGNGPLLPWEDRQKVFRALGMAHGLDNHAAVISGLVKLGKLTWWRRVWTVQEIVLAERATLRCGGKEVAWVHLVQLAAFALDVTQYNTCQMFGRPMDETVFDEVTWAVMPLYSAAGTLSDLARKVRSGIEIGLEQLVWAQVLTRQATDPRDLIYALLGLVSPAQRMVVEVDYGKDKTQVYRSAMKAMILEYWRRGRMGPGPLHLLQESSTSERDPALPSWAPDFEILHTFKTTTLAANAVGSSLVLRLEPLYNASLGDSDVDRGVPKFLDDDSVLEMEGVLVDQVEKLGVVCPTFPDGQRGREDQLRDTVDRWWELLPKGDSEKNSDKDTKEAYVGGGSLEEAFWRTVTFDLLLTDRDYFAGNPNRRDSRLPRRSPGMPPSTAYPSPEMLEGILDAPVPKTVLERLQGRRLFTTKTGFFGLGPASMQVDDLVCVLRGGLFPTVIRPAANGRYVLVGECFVHGIMDGEMIDLAKKGSVPWQPFRFV